MEVDIKHIIEAAQAGGAILKKYFGQSLDIVQKSIVSDLKSQADEESEATIIEVLKKHFPEANIHAEETGKFENGSDYTFIVDPLDGTHNFVLGMPTFTVSIGLVHQDKIIAGVIYVPAIDQTFYAERDKGAFLEGKRINASTETDVRKAILSTGFGYATTYDRANEITARIWAKRPVRVLDDWCSTYKLCLIGLGKIEGLVIETGEIHDYVAGKLIAREAGCIISNHQGEPEQDELSTEFLVASTPEIVKELIDVVA